MYQIELYFLRSTLVLSFYIDVVVTLSINTSMVYDPADMKILVRNFKAVARCSQYHGCWRLGFLRRQDISTHDIASTTLNFNMNNQSGIHSER